MNYLTNNVNDLKRIVFISDLHFDFTDGKYNIFRARKNEKSFLKVLKKYYSDCMVILAGDFYNSYLKTLEFIKKLDKNKIFGFFVLGNHDYWNNGELSIDDITRYVYENTKNNIYFKFLTTGLKYNCGDLCIIGDTGWTSFTKNNKTEITDNFWGLPECEYIKNFNPEEIIIKHNKWISFANSTLRTEEKVIVITHFPMLFLKDSPDCWFSSRTNLLNCDNSWRIFGHTHNPRKGQKYNNVCAQRGYADKVDRHYFFENITYDYIGILDKVSETKAVVNSNSQIVSSYYSLQLVKARQLETIKKIKSYGYKRCAANKRNFVELANNPKEYIKCVKETVQSILRYNYIGYTYKGFIKTSIIDAIKASIEIIESGQSTDLREFMTAAIITGYVYNGQIMEIENMRKLNDYDIIRFYLMLLTIKKYQLGIEDVTTIKRVETKSFIYANVEICIPKINNKYSLTLEEAMSALNKDLHLKIEA